MTLQALNKPMQDLGGVAVLWDTDVGTLVQDPSQVPAGMPQNQYGAGDLFRDPSNGDIYQLNGAGGLDFVRAAAPAPLVAGGTPAAGTVNTVNVSSAARAWQTTGSGSSAAINVGGNPTQFAQGVVDWLSRSDWIGGFPNWGVLALGAVGYSMLKQRRRRNPPTYRNPRRSAPAGGWPVDESIRAMRANRDRGDPLGYAAGPNWSARRLAKRKRALRLQRRPY